MAKQLSMKQQMYQQIANSQVQQVMKEQRDQDLKMAQDLIAQYQPSEDDMALAQSLISQYKQPAPVKQATVNEVKAESTPRQQIPSLEDFFTPTTASGKNINKESAKYIQRKEKERELAAKNSKEAIAQKIVENKEVKPFVPETNIEDQNSVNDYRKALLGGTDTERANKAEAVFNKKKDKKETEVQKQLSAIPESAIEQYAQSKGISIEAAKAEVEEGVRKANAMNTTIAPTKESKIDKETTEKAQTIAAEQKRKANQKQQTSYEAALNNAGDAITGVVNGPIRLAGMATGNDWDLVGDERRERVEQANEQRPVASGVGRTLGMIGAAAFLGGGVGGAQAGGTTAGEAFNAGYGDAMLNGATKGEAVANALNSGGRQLLSNTAKAMPVDLATDIIPTLANDIASDKSVPEVIKDTAINTLINGGFDAIGDVVSLLKPFKAVGRTVDGSIDELIDTTKNLPSSETDNLAKQIANIEAPNNLVESVGNPNKVMAESADLAPKVEKPETLKQTIEVPKTGDSDYVSQFRTHNEQNFNMTDEELNNKYFNTQNENFHFLKGNRADDLVNATKSLENDYEGTVQKLINKPRDTQFTPQEVDEGFMAWNKELNAGRETGDYSKAADIMYRMTQDSHDKGAGLQAYAAWKKNSPAGVVLDANEAARNMAVNKYGDKYIKNMDDLTKKIDDILKNGESLESQANQIDTLIKNLKGKGYRNGVKGADELKIALANGQLNSIVDVHDILYNANKIPNLSAKAQSDIAGIASEIYAKELTDAEKAKYINQINMILSQERNWSIKDKAIELSHILMLSGMRTHEKNIIANIGMLPQEALARKISALGQNAYALIDKDFKPTQAFHVSKGSKELAEKMFEAKGGAASIVEGIADKYTNRLADRIGATYMFGKMGKKNIAAKAGDKLLDTIPGLKKLDDTATELANKALKKIGSEGAYDAMDANVSVLENYRQAIYGSLSGLEDNPFVKENFVQRLASYIEAQGIKNLDDIPEDALDIARAEAVKATFKDDNAITELFSSIKKLPGIGELLLPFTKTPANLLARMIDFSPIGLARELLGVVNKNSRFARDTVGETIDAISKGLGGSLTMALGMYLYANGMLTGKKDDDANIANYMTNEGWQQYSVSTKGIADFINKYLGTDLDLGDSYHDFSFMQPSTTNFITGIELWDELMDGKKISEKTVDDIFNRVKSIGGSYTDALLAQSTLQNVSELFGSQYSDDGVGGNLMQNAIEWPTRFVSGAISDTAKLSDDTRREYYSKNKPIDTMKNAVMSKLPILSKQLPAKYDVFGNEMTRNKSEAGKWFNTLGNPTTSSYRSDDPLYDYVDKLNAESKEGDYVPTKYGRYVKLNDETKLDLDNKQYSELTKVTGETRAKLLKEAQNSAVFNNLSPDKKVGILDSLEEIAKYEGFNAITDKAKITEETQKVVDMYKEGGVDGIVNNAVAKDIAKNSGVSSGSKAADAIQEAVNSGNMEEANKIAKVEENYNRACQLAGVEEKSSGTRKAWEEGGTTGLKEYVAKQKLFEKYDLDNDSASRAVYDHYGENGLKDLQAFKEQGIKGSTVVGIYQSAKSDGNVPSIKDFATTYKKMDGYGDSNGTVSQKEFVAYLEKNGINSQEDAQKLATIYGDWSTIPVLGKKGWQFKKTK